MSEISLTSYKIASNEKQIYEINSVLLPDGRQPPSDLFTALYGARDPLVALQKAQITARQQNLFVHRADLKVLAGTDVTSRINSDLAPNAIFINLERLEPEFEAKLIQHISPDSEQKISAIIDANAELLHKLFDCPDLPLVNVIVWPASYKENEKLQVATVKDVSQISVKNTTGSFSANPLIAY